MTNGPPDEITFATKISGPGASEDTSSDYPDNDKLIFMMLAYPFMKKLFRQNLGRYPEDLGPKNHMSHVVMDDCAPRDSHARTLSKEIAIMS